MWNGVQYEDRLILSHASRCGMRVSYWAFLRKGQLNRHTRFLVNSETGHSEDRQPNLRYYFGFFHFGFFHFGCCCCERATAAMDGDFGDREKEEFGFSSTPTLYMYPDSARGSLLYYGN